MTTLTHAIVELKEVAARSKVTIEQAANVISELDAREAQINAARRSSDEDRQKIDAYMRGLDGELKDMSPADILAGANVSKKQGTSAYASRQKRLLLTHQK